MAPKKRKSENNSLPRRWRKKHGAYYYRVPTGQEHLWDGKKSDFRLGGTEAEAYREWANRIDLVGEIQSMNELIDRYLAEHLPTLGPKTNENYRPALKRLRAVFGAMDARHFEPHHANTYFTKIKKNRSLAVARTDITVLRGLFSEGMKWGAVKVHPMTGMRFEQLAAASDEVHEWEIDAMLSIPADTRTVRMAQLYTRLKLMLGLRRGDLLRLRLSQITDDGIHCTLHKTAKSSGVKMRFPWFDPDTGAEYIEFRSVVNQILAIPPKRIGDSFLFTTREGKGFVNEDTGRANGFDTLWSRFMDKVMKQTEVDHRIKEKTLRAYVGNASKSDEDAKERLGHTTVTTTLKHYRRKARVVTPLFREAGKKA